MEKRTALLFGATGLVGNEVLQQLLNSPIYRQVTIYVRREIDIHHSKLIQKVINFDFLMEYQSDFEIDDTYVCLGTTIKKAKSKEAFKKVDFVYPLEIARIAKKSKVKRYLIITAMGSNPDSKVFYNQVKGQVEHQLKELNLPATYVFRPSLLLGERNEFRIGEKMAEYLSKPLSFLLIGPLKKYKPIKASIVAKAMLNAALKTSQNGFHTYESDQIVKLADDSFL